MYALFIVVKFISRIQEFNSFLADRFISGDGANDQIGQFLAYWLNGIVMLVVVWFLSFFSGGIEDFASDGDGTQPIATTHLISDKITNVMTLFQYY